MKLKTIMASKSKIFLFDSSENKVKVKIEAIKIPVIGNIHPNTRHSYLNNACCFDVYVVGKEKPINWNSDNFHFLPIL